MQNAGTGYRREEYSPSRRVEFNPESMATESILIKYEWRATLCRMNVIPCGTTYGQTRNRLWDDYGYCPPPPVWTSGLCKIKLLAVSRVLVSNLSHRTTTALVDNANPFHHSGTPFRLKSMASFAF
jgi:hypothetical protein